MLKRLIVLVVAMVAMVALIAGGVVSAVDVTSPGSDPNENPDENTELAPETDLGDGQELDEGEGSDDGGEADPGAEPGQDPSEGEEPDGDEGLDGEDGDDEEDEDIVSNVFAANIIQAYPELSLTEADIQALREAGFGWGDISIACGIAVNSGESLDTIMALLGEGTGWGEIAESLGIEDRAFGQYVKGVVGKGHAYGKAKQEQRELDDAASMDMVLEGYGLSEEDVTGLIELGYSAKDILCAVSLVASTGEASNLELVLRLRTEKQNWSQVTKELGVEDDDVSSGITARNRVELKQALKLAVKEQVKEQKNKDNKGNKDKDKPANSGKPAHAGQPGQGAKGSEKEKGKGSSGK